MKNTRRARLPSLPLRMRWASARPVLELLEDRTLPSGGEWLVRLQGLPGDTTAAQMQAAQDLLHAARLLDQDLQVVDHTGLDGNVVVAAPEGVPVEIVNQELQDVPGF